MKRLYTVQDFETAEIVSGYRFVEEDNAVLRMIAWDRALSAMSDGEIAHGTDRKGVRYVVVCTIETEGASK